MDFAPDNFKALNQDLIVDIMSRLEGCTLAAAASACRDLQDATKHDGLWQKLCHETWPSTSAIQLASSETGDPSFKSLYSDAFPLILYDASKIVPRDVPGDVTLDTSLSPSDFTSLVDIFYKGHSIFSKAVNGIAKSSVGTCSESFKRFLSYPFELELLGAGCPKGTGNDAQDSGNNDDSITNLPSSAFMGCDEREDELRNNLAENIRLSWILLNTKKGRAVNISSWKPRFIHRNGPSREDYTFYFECPVATEDGTEIHMLSELVIMVKCKMMIRQGCIRWKDISLVIKDTDGSHLNGEQSMKVINKALICSRSTNHDRVDKGYQLFQKQKTLMKLGNEKEELLANILSAAIAIASLVIVGYVCATLL